MAANKNNETIKQYITGVDQVAGGDIYNHYHFKKNQWRGLPNSFYYCGLCHAVFWLGWLVFVGY